MKSFKEWQQNSIVIDLEKFKNTIKKKTEDLIDSVHENRYQASIFKAEPFLKELQVRFATYPMLPHLMRALESKNLHYIYDQVDKLRKWMQNNNANTRRPYPDDQFNFYRKIYTYIDTLEDKNEDFEQEYHQQEEQIVQNTYKEMVKIQTAVSEAIERIYPWHNTPVRIVADCAEDHYGVLLEANNTAHVYVGEASFAYWLIEGKLEIEDIIEGDDEDFFPTPGAKADYFNLINELKKPGSTSKGNILLLYTARPKKDREFYMTAKTLPINVFLTNNFSHAEGLSRDLSSDEPRDIWKVRINSKYLTQTLDGPIKYYQVTSPEAKVESIKL